MPSQTVDTTVSENADQVEAGRAAASRRGTYFAASMVSMWTLFFSASAVAETVT